MDVPREVGSRSGNKGHPTGRGVEEEVVSHREQPSDAMGGFFCCLPTKTRKSAKWLFQWKY